MTKSDSPLLGGLAAPARRALAQAGYTRIEQFSELTEAEVRQLHGMGPKAIEQISPCPRRHGAVLLKVTTADHVQGRTSLDLRRR